MKTTSTADEFRSILRDNALVIVDYSATWCGPCKMISPIFQRLSEDSNNRTLKFITVDVDENQQIAKEEGIQAMPTFKVYLQGREIRELKGAQKSALEELVRESIAFYNDKLKDLATLRAVNETESELMDKSVKALKEMLTVRNISLIGLAEKRDLVQKLLEQK